MSFMFPSSDPEPTPTPVAVTASSPTSDAANQAAKDAAAKLAAATRKRKGVASTIIAGQEGDLSTAATQKAQLLGG